MPEEIPQSDLEIVRRLAGLPEHPPAATREFADLLIRDRLTGVYNRAYFEQRLAMALARSAPESPVALYVIDMDRLKSINDEYGHQAGDRAIFEVARGIRTALPASGAVCRVGGDEFAAIVPSVGAEEAAWLQLAVERAITRCKVAVGRGRPAVPLSVSVGLALAPADGNDAEVLFARADQRMYLAKRGVVAAPAPTAEPARGQAPLVGRAATIRQLMSRVRQAQGGVGGLVVLTGQAGVGKTRLLQEVAGRARHLGFRSLTLSLGESDAGGHLRRLAGIFIRAAGRGRAHRLARKDPTTRQLVGLAYPAADALAEPPTYGQVAGAVRQLLAAASGRRPMLCLVDDLQHAEPAVQAVLARLAPHLADLPVLFLAAGRTGPTTGAGEPGTPDWLAGLPDCPQVNVPPLTPAAARQLAQWAVGSVLPAGLLDRSPAVREGNPLLILRLAVAGLLDSSEHPLDLAQAYDAHLQMLSEPARSVLCAAAVLGPETRPEWLAAVAPETPDTIAQGLAELIRAGWLHQVDHRWLFTHPMAWETAYDRTPAVLRRALHRVAASTLAALPGVAPAVLARHYDASGEWMQAQAQYCKAGQEAEAGFAYQEAAHCYRRYLELGQQLGSWTADAAEVGLGAGQLFIRCDDFSAAVTTLQMALPFCQSDSQKGRVMLRLAYALYHSSEYDRFREYLPQAAAHLRRAGPSRELAENLTYLIKAEAASGDVARLRGLGEEVLAVATRLGDPAQELLWLAGAGHRLHEGGCHDLAQACQAAAEERLGQVSGAPPTVLAHGLMDLAVMRMARGQVSGALELIRRAIRYAEATGEPYEVLNTGLQEATWLAEYGFSAAVRDRLQKLEQLVRRSKSAFRQGWWLTLAARACLFRHDLAGADRYAGLFGQLSATLAPGYVRDGEALQTRIQLARGERPDPTAWDPATMLAARGRTALACAQLLTGAEVQLASGHLAAAAELVSAARQQLVDWPEESWVDWVAGRVMLAQGQAASALAVWRRATLGQKLGYYQAMAHRASAELLLTAPHPTGAARARRLARAAAHLRRARRLFERLENRHELLGLQVLESALLLQGAPAQTDREIG